MLLFFFEETTCLTIVTVVAGWRVDFTKVIEQKLPAAIVQFSKGAHHFNARLLEPLVALLGFRGCQGNLSRILWLIHNRDLFIG